MAPPSIIHQRATVGVKVFDQIVNMPSSCIRATRVADVSGAKPMGQTRQAPETGARTSVPKLPLCASKIADRMIAEVGAGRTRAQSTRRLQGVLKAHGDMPPVENDRCLRNDLTLQLPQSDVAIG